MDRPIGVIALAALLGVKVVPVCAEPATTPAEPADPSPAFEVLLTPYIWFPWVDVDVRPANRRIPSASSSIDPGNLYGHTTWVPFLGEAEFRRGPFGAIIDYIHVPLRTGSDTRDVLFHGATDKLTVDTGTAMFLYRPVMRANQYVDVGVGVRAWGIAGTIALNQGLLPKFTVSNGLSWADPILAVRYHREFGDGFGATAYGDFGGFGLGAHYDWQLVGTIDYSVNSSTDLHIGIRSLNFSYGAERANIMVNMNGPILAATFHL